jgi:hypothetical protein
LNGGVSESALNPPNEAVICGEQSIDLSLFGAGQMQGIEGSIAELLEIFGALKRRIGQNDTLRGGGKEFQQLETRIAVRVIQNFSFQNFAYYPSNRSLENTSEELLNGVRFSANASLTRIIEKTKSERTHRDKSLGFLALASNVSSLPRGCEIGFLLWAWRLRFCQSHD